MGSKYPSPFLLRNIHGCDHIRGATMPGVEWNRHVASMPVHLSPCRNMHDRPETYMGSVGHGLHDLCAIPVLECYIATVVTGLVELSFC